MKAKVLIQVAAESILKNKLRTLLTTLGIIIGVAAVLVMVAMGQGAQAQIERQVNNLGTNMLVVTPGSSTQGGVSQGAQTFNRLTLEDAEAIARESVLVAGTSPVIASFSQIVGGTGNWRTVVYGVAVEYQQIRDWPIASGRFFDESDVRGIRKVAVLGKTLASNLFPDQDPVGQQIRVRNVPFTIIGVMTEKGQTATGSDQDDILLAPYTTVDSRLSGRSFIAQILASTYSPEDLPAAREDLRQILREAHALAEWQEDDFTIRNQADIATVAQSTTRVMTLLLASIASISLLVGGIGIMNIMLVSVTERTREIGIRMSVGARGSDVLTQFLVESVVVSVMGGLIGLGVGVAGAALLERITGWATVLRPETVVVALGFSAAVGIFFGFYPARRAAALNPIEALRYE